MDLRARTEKFKTPKQSVIVAAILTLAIALSVLIGWALEITALKSVLPGLITMKANTALCFAFCAAALWLSLHESKKASLAMALLLLGAASISLATLAEYIYGFNFGIDELLFTDAEGLSARFPPGRLAPITAVNFVFVAAAIASVRARRSLTASLGQLCALFVLFASFQALVGYLINTTYLFGTAYYTQMAVHTALSFVVLALGSLLARPERGLIRVFMGASATAQMVRRTTLAAVLLPPLVRWISSRGVQAGLYDADFATLIGVVGSTGLLVVILLISGSVLLFVESAKQELAIRERAASTQLRTITDRLPALIAYFDLEARYRFVNATYTEIFGHPLEHYIGRTIPEILGTTFADRARPRIDAALRGETVTYDNVIVDQTGRARDFEITYVPDRDDATNEMRGFVLLAQDVSQRKAAQAELERAKHAAEVANLAKSHFLANMSHEIRTPLGVITGFLDLIKTSGGLDIDRYMAVIDRNSQQLLRLIDEILDLSKVEAGKLVIECVRFSLADLLLEIESVMSIRAKERGIFYRQTLDGRVPSIVDGDAMRLRQVLSNLIGNAIKFTEKGFVELSVRVEGSALVFTVRDTGPGIAPDTVSRLFRPFSQADDSNTRKFGGTGLGLALTRGLCEALGGGLKLLASEPGLGSTFEARVLAASPPGVVAIGPRLHAEPTPVVALLPSLTGLKVLLTEDSPDNQAIISKFLKSAGAHVEIASNGLEGVARALKDTYDVVLMDIQMPVMDGLTATTRLREHGYDRPIIALTAHAMQEDRRKSEAAGCDFHLTKPVVKETLLKTVERFANEGRNAAESSRSKI